MVRKIVIEIKNGEINVKTTGFQGKNCTKEMKKFGELTGLKPDKIKMTSEAYQAKQKRSVEVQ